jgi:nucleoside-diphosphate-sugar epimerase
MISRQWDSKPLTQADYRTADAMSVSSLTEALDGCDVVYSVLGLPYSTVLWQKLWVPMTQNVLTAAAGHECRLIYLDNVYGYGLTRDVMTENTPYLPISKKGAVRADAAAVLSAAMQSKKAEVIIARSADFLGPGAANSIVGLRFFKGIIQSKAPVRHIEWLGDPRTKHCYGYTLDIVRALALLGELPASGYNQTWHLPTAGPITGNEWSSIIGKQAQCTIKLRSVRGFMVRLAALFSPAAQEQAEMQYQVENDYLFSDEKFMQAFPEFHKTTNEEIAKQSLVYFTGLLQADTAVGSVKR